MGRKFRVHELFGCYDIPDVGMSVCRSAAEWLNEHWPNGLTASEFWLECNVPTWMAWMAHRLSSRLTEDETADELADALSDIWDDVRAVVGDSEDSEARPEMADALREIIPVEYFEEMARQARQKWGGW